MIGTSLKYSFLPLLLFLSFWVSGQNMSVNGRFNTHYFSVDDFGSSGQIWAGAQGADGNVYFGNRQDILTYNGIEWSKIRTKNNTKFKSYHEKIKESKVREIIRASDDVLYVGRENNFGYIAYNDSGAPRYYPLFAQYGTNEPGNFWNIFELNSQKILFVGENTLYTVANKKVTQLTLPSGLRGFTSRTSCRFGKGVLILFQKGADNDKRVSKYIYIDAFTGKMKEVFPPGHIKIRNIRGSVEINGSWYILDIRGQFYSATLKNGSFVWNSENATIFPQLSGISPNYIRRNGNHLFMGTETEGLLIADLNGTVIRRIDAYDGLKNLGVFKLFHDEEGNLWLCLDNGIQLIESSSPVTFFNNTEGVSSLAEAIVFDDHDMLVGLHSDIFTTEVRNTHKYFTSLNTIRQDVFDMQSFSTSKGKRTIVIGYNGIYEYFPATNQSKSIAPAYAFKLCQDPDNRDVIYVTLESGIGRLKLQPDGNWSYEDLITDLSAETFSLTVRKGNVYFGVLGTGLFVYNIRSGKTNIIKEKNPKKGENCSYYVESFRDRIFVETTRGLAILSPDGQKMVGIPQNKEFFGNAKVDLHRIVNINNEQLWLVVYSESVDGKFEFQSGWLEEHGHDNWKWVRWPLAGMRKSGIISSIAQGPDNEIWLGASNGVYVVNFDAIRKYRSRITVSIDRFEVDGKVLRFNVFKAKKLEALDYSQNSFRVTFHINSFSGKEHIEYRYKLEGFNDDWSDWSDQYYKDFQKIPEGTYVLKLQGRNGLGIESEILSYEITILPPWYRTIWAYILYVFVLIILIFFIVQLSTQRVKRQNQRLEEIVHERTREIAEQNQQLEQQKAEITQKTTDILDSIQYAKRIQNTILPAESRLSELFDEHFVFYRPKDIVSGDFYWAREVQGIVVFAAVDCTGHGVPGSLVSIVGNNGLLRAVNEFKLTEPHEILDKLREIVVGAFRSEGQLDVKDGMDIALCSIDYETGMLKFAGANNECVIIRNGEVIELKPDKQPIGQFVEAKPFNQKEFQLEDNDCIYLYTDGYVDQFGGDKAKKFKSRPFKSMLLQLSHLPMQQQFDSVQHAFDTWKNDLDQVDDVCVFAVRYKKRS